MEQLPRINTSGDSRFAKEYHKKCKLSTHNPPPESVPWSDGTRLVPEDGLSGKKRSLKAQPKGIQEIIRFAIEAASKDVILRSAWPEENSRNTYGHQLILKACHNSDLLHSYPSLKEVKQRIKREPKFSKGISDLVGYYVYYFYFC